VVIHRGQAQSGHYFAYTRDLLNQGTPTLALSHHHSLALPRSHFQLFFALLAIAIYFVPDLCLQATGSRLLSRRRLPKRWTTCAKSTLWTCCMACCSRPIKAAKRLYPSETSAMYG